MKSKLITLLFLVVFINSCNSMVKEDSANSNRIAKMHNIYKSLYDVYEIIWSNDSKFSQEDKVLLRKSISEISDEFRSLHQNLEKTQIEPGFQYALASNISLLDDVKSQFDSSDNDYLQWRLRGLTANCSNCHTRVVDKTEFYGQVPNIEECYPDRCLAVVDFLISTRQFKRSINKLESLIYSYAKDNDFYFWKALKRYLLVKIRVKRDIPSSIAFLEKLSKESLSEYQNEIIRIWLKDLENISFPINKSEVEEITGAILPETRKILNNKFLDKNFIKAVYSSNLLHQLLLENISRAEKSKALLLLGKSYYVFNMQIFNGYPSFFLEQSIKENPNSNESEQAFFLYRNITEINYSGSSGLNLPEKEKKKLEVLRRLSR